MVQTLFIIIGLVALAVFVDGLSSLAIVWWLNGRTLMTGTEEDRILYL